MESASPGLCPRLQRADSPPRPGLTAAPAIEDIWQAIGEILAVTVAEIGHGTYRANTPERTGDHPVLNLWNDAEERSPD